MKIVFTAAVALLLSCICPVGMPCPDCGPAVIVLVINAVSGAPVTDVSLGATATCSSNTSATRCVINGKQGEYHLVATAPGYADSAVDVVVPGGDDSALTCCPCDHVTQTVTVAMNPL